MKIIVESSARHAHVTQQDLETLFGAGYQLTNKRDLSQPGQFLSDEKIKLVGPKGEIDRVSILGPVRPSTQVELSFTDARSLGITPPVRESGDVCGSCGVTLIGPNGQVEICEGAIVAKRHLHLTPEDCAKFNLADKQIVSVKIPGDRSVTFNQVVVRCSPSFRARMHIDFDEANAAGMAGEVEGEIIP